MTQPGSDQTLEERIAEQQAEYGQYVAAQNILYNGVPAYNAGDPVPASNVKAHGYLKAGLVVKAGDPDEAVSPNAATQKQVDAANTAAAKSAAAASKKG